MKQPSILFPAVLAISLVFVPVKTSHAQSPAWRCDGADCPEALINDIEDIINRDWPTDLFVSVPGIPYSCLVKSDECTHCIGPGGGDSTSRERVLSGQSGATTQSLVQGVVPWGVSLTSDLGSFLIGRYDASADLLGTLRSSVDQSIWTNTAISYLFLEPSPPVFVMTRDGSTGVVDLGNVNFSIAEGGFWNSSLPLFFFVPTADIVVSCNVGGITVNPGGTTVRVNYPVAWTPVREAIAGAIRAQFRRAVRLAATGLSCPDNGAGLCRASVSPTPTASESARQNPPALEVRVGGQLVIWRSDELKAASSSLASVSELTSAEKDRLGARQGWSLRQLVRRKLGDKARVTAVISEAGDRVELDASAWRGADSTPILRVNNNGQFRFQWLGTRSRLPGMKGVRALEVIVEPERTGTQ